MASTAKRGRGYLNKDSDKRSAKKAGETPTIEGKNEIIPETEEKESVVEEDQQTVEEPPPRDPSPEPVYEEPVLTQLIVESYHGEKVKGLYEGVGEVHFTGGHHYKGEFSEGLMHGQGCYTWSDGVTFEGEFNRNQVTGKGQYCWPDGSIYEGSVVGGLRHGFGTFHCANKQMSYTGEWNLGTRHGKGRMEYDSEGMSFYEGDWVENVRHGFGTRRYPSGNVYQGMWENNERHGEGNMRWLDRDQIYSGHWNHGIQDGSGQHIWFLRRKPGSQYPMRNSYDGEFVNGKRHGTGTFFYANGARYDGEWQDNLKSGKGKFTFKNGRIYEGVFEKDHIVEYPDFQMDGVSTPDLSQIRTRTPLPAEQMSVCSNDSQNTYSPSFNLDVDCLLQEFTETDREEETTQVVFVIMRHVTYLRKVYTFYSNLGYEESPDNTFIMNRMQFWRFLKDCQLHHQDLTLMDMDRALAVNKSMPAVEEMHNPYGKILFREFTNYLVTLAFSVYQSQHERETSPVLAWCLSKLISDNILRHACQVKGHIYCEDRKAANVLVHMDQAYAVYTNFSSPRKLTPHEPVLKMRQFLFLLKDLKLINNDLTAKDVIEILAKDDPQVMDEDGFINLELEMTFMEFFDALVGCAEKFVTEAVVKDPMSTRPSTSVTQENTISMPGSPSRATSNIAGLEESSTQGIAATASCPQLDGQDGGASETAASISRARSTSQMTSKTVDETEKMPEVQSANINSASAADTQRLSATRPDTAKKSEVSVVGVKKSASFLSTHSLGGEVQGGLLLQSLVSMPSDVGMVDADTEEEGEEELDEETRQFNFWTHQVHIFFVRKFLVAAQKLALLQQLVQDRLANTPEELPEQEQLLALLLQQEEEEGIREAQEAEAAAAAAASPDAGELDAGDAPPTGKVTGQGSKADSTVGGKESASPGKHESASKKESRTRKSGRKKGN